MELDVVRLCIGNGPWNSLNIAHDCPGGVVYGSDWGMLHRLTFDLAVEEIRARFSAEVRYEEFEGFVSQLDAFFHSLSGTVNLKAAESDIKLEMSMDKHGHLTWFGTVRRPGPIPRATLDFVLEDDQTSLPGVLEQARSLLSDLSSEPVKK